MNDDRLARKAASGDRTAFEAIFRRYHQDLYRFCLATVGNPQDAQDALQNTMVKALRALPGEQREIKLRPWLYRVARNEAVETLRRRRNSTELEPGEPAPIPEMAEAAVARERLRQLLADLAELPERQRAALVMRELAGLGFAEIGEALETSPAVARQTLYEARVSLRQMEAGREMECEAVTRALSDGDGRMIRRREIRAHLRHCAECRAFRDGIATRRDELAAIAPLPLVLSGALLHGVLAGQGPILGAGAGSAAGAASAAGAGGGAAGVAGTIGAGKVVATSAIVKSAATVAVVATVGFSAAERGGVIDLPPTGEGGKPTLDAPRPSPSAGPDERSAAGGAAASVPAGNRNGGDGKAEPTRSPGRGATAPARDAQAKPGASQVGGGPSAPSKPATGQRGDGRGQSPVARRSPPESLPAASQQGQQAATARKPSQANPSPGPGGEPPGRGVPSKSSKPPKEPAAPAQPTSPPVSEPAEPAGGRADQKGGGPAEALEP